MAADRDTAGKSFGRRLEQWARESADFRAMLPAALGGAKDLEEASVIRYQRSRTAEMALPHPAISQQRYERLNQRHRQLVMRLTLAVTLAPLLVVLGMLAGPLAAQLTLWALLVPVAALAVHDVRALGATNTDRHLSLRGGLADAWSDWVRAREQLDALDGASQARAALATNEPRMQSLVMALSRAESRPHHKDTEEHAASRAWVYRSAAKAKALAAAEQELEEATQRHVDAGDLEFAPDGDLGALDHALDTARELTRGVDEPPSLP